uniref:Uncharacterized protein n=1 Tax=Paramormyrops kingsleyae TaxID=1676925 RepID=A0A3B3S8A7_9TELE
MVFFFFHKHVHKHEVQRTSGHASYLSPRKRRALVHLRRNKSMIKPADKGGAMVIMDRATYVNEAHHQLNQPQYYQRLEKPLSHKTLPEVKRILLKLKDEGFLDKKQFTYLFPPAEPRSRLFYLLPKIQRPNIIGHPFCNAPWPPYHVRLQQQHLCHSRIYRTLSEPNQLQKRGTF